MQHGNNSLLRYDFIITEKVKQVTKAFGKNVDQLLSD
jgi:hypothetical protein